ncbi:hypothetical protein N8T08_000504 [Aspergillus melleus]|uniref:Uncharacterized protein n=1 Tax=Aspergillus melleus TaxID=138277 RepID=A0ACC3BBE2_9EURO|nr:hypothetical protein N8T08_000504 [Aspergillus melleus]
MANLAKNDNAGNLIIYYGELFCRKEDCAKGQKKYTATNNLRTHLKAHENTSLAENNKGGRVGQKEMDRAISTDIQYGYN